MNKTDIAKAQGKCLTKSTHGRTLAIVLDTSSLYTERSAWGKPVHFHKTSHTVVKQDSLGCVTDGWLVLHVSAIGWDANYGERIAQAEMFIRTFHGTAEDVLNADGSVNRDNLPQDVTVSLFNNRNLFPRPVNREVKTVEGNGFILEEDGALVTITVANGTTYPWLRADNAAKAYAKGSGRNLVRTHNTDNKVFTYHWTI